MGIIEYHSNNSGGHWWLSDDDWHVLEKAGWVVHWIHDPDDPSHEHPPPNTRFTNLAGHNHGYNEQHSLTRVTSNGDRFLGGLASSAAKETSDPGSAVAEWESVTGKDASAEGCNCCGEPHSFTFTDDDGGRLYSSVEVTRTELTWS